MIDEKRLLCAFIYSAYDSGYCGLGLDSSVKEEHMRLYQDYVAQKGSYPLKEIEETQSELIEIARGSSMRDYIYNGHLDVVRQRIEEQTGRGFEEAVSSSPFVLVAALKCPVNFYKVNKVDEISVSAQNLFLPEKTKSLRVMEGLSLPSIGDTVSAHWGYYLEKVDDVLGVDMYKDALSSYFDVVKSAAGLKK